MSFELPDEALLDITSNLILELPKGHRQLLDLEDTAGMRLGETLLSASRNSAQMDGRKDQALALPLRAGGQFVLLGVGHIWAGYDHLLFLLGLLVVSWRLMPELRIITAFTVAHSLTLALAALGFVRLPASLVEPLIALSVVYVGIQNLRHGRAENRWVLTFCFGLVHGLGFAGVLEELLSGRTQGLLVPLFSFNLGVEIGQLAVAATLLPLMNLLARRPSWLAISTATVSVGLILVGSFWVIERIAL